MVGQDPTGMDAEVEAWATAVLRATDIHECELRASSTFSSVLELDESAVRSRVRQHLTNEQMFGTISYTLKSYPQLSAILAARNGLEWQFPLKRLTTLSAEHAQANGIPWDVCETVLKLVEIILHGARAVKAEARKAVQGVGEGKGEWHVELFGLRWKVPGKWNRSEEAKRLFWSEEEHARKKLSLIDARLETAFVASEVVFQTMLDLQKLLEGWRTWHVFRPVSLAMADTIVGFLDGELALGRLMESEKGDSFVKVLVETALNVQNQNVRHLDERGPQSEALRALAVMLVSEGKAEETGRTRRGSLMSSSIKILTRGAGVCPGRLLCDKFKAAVASKERDTIQALLVICRYAIEDFGIQNWLAILHLSDLIHAVEKEERTDWQNNNLCTYLRSELTLIKCENPECGETLKRYPRCRKCHHAFYCGRDCQQKHFEIHKTECPSLKKCTHCRPHAAGLGESEVFR